MYLLNICTERAESEHSSPIPVQMRCGSPTQFETTHLFPDLVPPSVKTPMSAALFDLRFTSFCNITETMCFRLVK